MEPEILHLIPIASTPFILHSVSAIYMLINYYVTVTYILKFSAIFVFIYVCVYHLSNLR